MAGLPELTLEAGGQLAVVTRSETPFDRSAAVRLAGTWWTELAAVLAALELRHGAGGVGGVRQRSRQVEP